MWLAHWILGEGLHFDVLWRSGERRTQNLQLFWFSGVYTSASLMWWNTQGDTPCKTVSLLCRVLFVSVVSLDWSDLLYHIETSIVVYKWRCGNEQTFIQHRPLFLNVVTRKGGWAIIRDFKKNLRQRTFLRKQRKQIIEYLVSAVFSLQIGSKCRNTGYFRLYFQKTPPLCLQVHLNITWESRVNKGAVPEIFRQKTMVFLSPNDEKWKLINKMEETKHKSFHFLSRLSEHDNVSSAVCICCLFLFCLFVFVFVLVLFLRRRGCWQMHGFGTHCNSESWDSHSSWLCKVSQGSAVWRASSL